MFSKSPHSIQICQRFNISIKFSNNETIPNSQFLAVVILRTLKAKGLLAPVQVSIPRCLSNTCLELEAGAYVYALYASSLRLHPIGVCLFREMY